MAVIVELPKDKNFITLSDWMEVNAFLDKEDNSSSLEDVVSQLKISNENDDSLIVDISAELISRVKKMGDAYPFTFNGQLLEVRYPKNFNGQWAYITCLFISYVGVQNGEKKIKAWSQKKITALFEEISGIAAKNFLQHKNYDSEILYFGAPRSSWKKQNRPFREALKILKSKIQDGVILDMRNASKQKDAGLDIVVWRCFPDQKSGKLILLCQCAAGADFKSKKYELQQLKNFFLIRSPYIRGLFIPHELNESDWAEYCFDSDLGLFFDRSRIGWYAKEWDGKKFSSIFNTLLKKMMLYKKAF